MRLTLFLNKNIKSCRIVSHVNKILQTFWLNLIFAFIKLYVHTYLFQSVVSNQIIIPLYNKRALPNFVDYNFFTDLLKQEKKTNLYDCKKSIY